MIIGCPGAAHEGNGGAIAAGYVRDFGIIGGDHHLFEELAVEGGGDGIADDGLAAEGPDILARQPLAPAAGGNDGKAPGHAAKAPRTAAMTRCTSASESLG